MTNSSNPVLVIGPKKAGKSFILKAIFPEIENENKLCLETKYYQCTIEIIEKRTIETETRDSEENRSSDDYQAVIIVINSISQLDKIDSNTLENKESRFLILNHYTHTHSEEDVQQCREWCLERGVEFMRFSQELENDEEHPRNRLKEGLECTMWRKMTIKNHKVGVEPLAHKRVIHGILSNPEKENNDEEFVTSVLNEDTEKKNEFSSEELSKSGKTSTQTHEHHETSMNDEQVEDSEVKATENFDNLLQKMLQLKANGHLLGFEERKEQATSLMMQLMEMLSEEGVEEELDSNHSSENENY